MIFLLDEYWELTAVFELMFARRFFYYFFYVLLFGSLKEIFYYLFQSNFHLHQLLFRCFQVLPCSFYKNHLFPTGHIGFWELFKET